MEDTRLDIDSLSFRDKNRVEDTNVIMAVGVGGGGGNAINHMYNQGVENVTFVVCNTDASAVRNSPVSNKVVIGNGLGAGNKPEVARNFAEEDIEKIRGIFNNNAQMVFITAGMGGGTGTGAGPVVARVAREKGLLTIGIVTIPFLFEGKKKILKALDGAEEMAKHVDALLIINNERLTEIYPDLDFLNAFSKADDTLSTAARSISEIITIDGHVNLDFNDVDTTLRNGGTAIISTGYGEGDHRVTKALRDALNSPLLKNRDIAGSKRLLMNLYMSGGSDGKSISMAEVNELRDFVASIDSEVDVIWGAAIDNSLGDKVKISILASGFEVTIREEEEQLEEEYRARNTKTISLSEGSVASAKTKEIDDLRRAYGANIEDLSSNYIILKPEEFDDDAVIDQLEKSATLTRDRSVIDNLRKNNVASNTPRTTEAPAKPTTDNSTIVF